MFENIKNLSKIRGDVNCVVWDASLVLAKYLETICQQRPDFLSGMRVLELGSGLGVVGLTAATLGAQVTLTDLPEALPLLRLNISQNKQKIGSMGGYAIAEVLVWGDNHSEIHKQEFDMVLLADCVYYEDVLHEYGEIEDVCTLVLALAVEPLLETLQHLNQSIFKKPTIYLTQEMRDTEVQKRLWSEFYEKLTEMFSVEKIAEDEQHINYRSPDIVLLKITKK